MIFIPSHQVVSINFRHSDPDPRLSLLQELMLRLFGLRKPKASFLDHKNFVNTDNIFNIKAFCSAIYENPLDKLHLY